MDKISFLLDNTVALATITKISEHVIKFSCSEKLPEESVLLSGFNILNENNNNNMSEDYYHGYTTIYRNIDSKIVLLSNDGSVYSGDEEVDTSSDFESLEPYIETLDDAKTRKISELSNICSENITSGVDVEINGGTEHFSYKEEDQINIKELFDLAIQTNTPVYYHADNQSCKLYSVEQITSIYISLAINKMEQTTYFNQLRAYVETLEDIESVNEVVYGQELIDEYLEIYNASVEQSNLLINTILSSKTVISEEE